MTPFTTHQRTQSHTNLRARASVSLTSGAIVVGILVSGCGGTSPAGSTLQAAVLDARTQFVGFASCMRAHGLSGYPDPVVSGVGGHLQATISPGSLDPNSPAFRSGDRACHRLLPNGGGPSGGGGHSAQQQGQDVLYADCMRTHGAPNFPDPGHDGAFTLPATINEQAPAYLHATQACHKVEPTSLSIYQTP